MKKTKTSHLTLLSMAIILSAQVYAMDDGSEDNNGNDAQKQYYPNFKDTDARQINEVEKSNELADDQVQNVDRADQMARDSADEARENGELDQQEESKDPEEREESKEQQKIQEEAQETNNMTPKQKKAANIDRISKAISTLENERDEYIKSRKKINHTKFGPSGIFGEELHNVNVKIQDISDKISSLQKELWHLTSTARPKENLTTLGPATTLKKPRTLTGAVSHEIKKQILPPAQAAFQSSINTASSVATAVKPYATATAQAAAQAAVAAGGLLKSAVKKAQEQLSRK